MHFFGSSRPYLGVQTQELNADLAEYFNVKEDGGALVLNVMEDTPAEKAGLKSGDVITRINDDAIEDPGDLIRAMEHRDEGDEVTVTYVRHGKTATAKATLEENRQSGFHMFGAPDGGRQRIRMFRYGDDGADVIVAPPDVRELRELDRFQLKTPRPPLPPGFGSDEII